MESTAQAPRAGADQMLAAAEQGRICALAAQGQRDLQARATAHPELFPTTPFDSALFSNIALANAFGAPWCSAPQLRVANRTVLWIFGIDWLIDHVAQSREEVDGLVARCLTVADGGHPAPEDDLGRFLAELQDELSVVPAFAALRPLWREELRRTVEAMAREWDWKSAPHAGAGDGLPSLDDYLANAANFASTIVNVAHWIYTGDEATLTHLDELIIASDEVQRTLRLVNDLGTYERDLRWGDLNALMLVRDRAEIEERLAALVASSRSLIAPLQAACPIQAAYLLRQIGFSSGFYRSSDFWGVR